MLPCNPGGHIAYQDSPEPRLPSCMLHSYLLALKLKVTSITQWARILMETPLYAILSGFPADGTHDVSTFYDFFIRIWKSDFNNRSPKDRFPKPKVTKGKKKVDKTPCDSSSIASRLLPLSERWNFEQDNPFLLFSSSIIRCSYLSVRWAYVCIKPDTSPPSTGQNTAAPKQTANTIL